MDSRHCPGHENWGTEDSVFLGDVEPSDEMHLWLNAMPWGTELINRVPNTPQSTAWLERVVVHMRAQITEAINSLSAGAHA